MSDTFCGKTCEGCEYQERLNCPGCRVGPGRRLYGDCRIAKCCIEKGHQNCVTCGFYESCGNLRGKHRMAENRHKSIESAKAREEAVAKCAPILGKWLWILFWLVIPSTIASFLTNENIASVIPGNLLPGRILDAAVTLAYGLVLLKLSRLEQQYQAAAGCTLLCGIVDVVLAVIVGGGEQPNWVLAITLPAAAVSMVGVYKEFMAHSAAVSWVDSDLAEHWETLWKVFIGLYCALFGSIVVFFISQILGALILLAAAIGILVVSVMRLVLLYQTAKAFRTYRSTAYPAEEAM